MNGDIRELYQQMIMDHNKNPKNFHPMPDASRVAEGYNPLCGDHFKVYVKMNGDVIRDISFDGAGCAISKSSASCWRRWRGPRDFPAPRHKVLLPGTQGKKPVGLGQAATV